MRLNIILPIFLIHLIKIEYIDGALKKSTIIRYFRKSFKFFIKIKIKQQNRILANLKEILQKAVNIKAKASLRSSTLV